MEMGWHSNATRAARNGVELWTRGEEPISGQFPELVRAAQALPEGTVLDGELLLWSEGHPKSFAELQTRLPVSYTHLRAHETV